MSSKANNYFGQTFGTDYQLKDFQHAARLFTDADQRLAPKQKFLYHVSFNINSAAITGLNFKYQHQNEINMLVKTADLPKFTIQADTLNQYNRKKNVQSKIDYQPVQIKFHDDNVGVTRQLWENYYNYYYADASAAAKPYAYTRSAMQGPNYIRTSYGLDNNSSVPFFTDITIYQMSKRSWNSYKLINPIITAWNHDTLDYSSSQPGEQSMTLVYEAVSYSNGVVYGDNPPGFGKEHYDKTPSPIALAGGAALVPTGGTTTLGGPVGVLAGIESVFGALGSGKAFESPANFISTAITAVNTYQNAKAAGSSRLRQEAGALLGQGVTELSRVGLSGIKNTSFPVSNPSQSTAASPVTLIKK
jgi:hypothetical protein